jgi:hypothetical protein
MKNEHLNALRRTLDSAGVPRRATSALKVLEFGDASPVGNAKVHDATNRLILSLLATSELRECIHVTGEMRALTDPFHRNLCAAMAAREKGMFTVLYHAPEEHRASPDKLVRWNLSRWAAKTERKWWEELKTIDVIAQRAVDLRAYDTLDEIQFSVFGGRYILLQEKHSDAAPKRVWLIESEEINATLSEKAREFSARAVDVDESWYRDFSLNLSGMSARRMLLALRDGARMPSDELCALAEGLSSTAPRDALDALDAMAFVKNDASDKWHITAAGENFLKAY